jgi:hypothetical protein
MSLHPGTRSCYALPFPHQLHDPHPFVRLNAIAILSLLGKKNSAAVRALAQALQDDSIPHRKMAAMALGHIGAKASVAVPALLEAFHDEVEGVRRRVSMALDDIRGDSADRGAVRRHTEPESPAFERITPTAKQARGATG